MLWNASLVAIVAISGLDGGLHKLSYDAPSCSSVESANGGYAMHFRMSPAPSSGGKAGEGMATSASLYEVLPTQGVRLWTRQNERRVWDAVVLTDGRVCLLSSRPCELTQNEFRWTHEFPDDNYVECVSRDGDSLWSYTLWDLDPLAVSLDSMYVSEEHGQAYAIIKAIATVLGPTSYDTHIIGISLNTGESCDVGTIDDLVAEHGSTSLVTDADVAVCNGRGFVWARMQLSKTSFEGVEDGVQWRDDAPDIFKRDGFDYAVKLVLLGFDTEKGGSLELLWESEFVGRWNEPEAREAREQAIGRKLDVVCMGEAGSIQAVLRDDIGSDVLIVCFQPVDESIESVRYCK